MAMSSQLSTFNTQLRKVSRAGSPTLNVQPSVELRIEELVLHGFAPGERYVIGDAVEQELMRLLGEQGVPVSLRCENATDEIRGAIFNMPPNAKPPAIGRQIAEAVYAGFNQ
jgi:hypothetical protein